MDKYNLDKIDNTYKNYLDNRSQIKKNLISFDNFNCRYFIFNVSNNLFWFFNILLVNSVSITSYNSAFFNNK